MQAIDIHAHYLPPLLIEKIRANRDAFPFVQMEDTANGTVRFKVGSEGWTRPVSPALMNVGSRIEEMDRQNIGLQINAGWLDIFGYSLPSEQAVVWSRFLNETLIEGLKQEKHAHRFAPLATVPLQDGEKAAEELRAAVKAGHLGAMIGTWIPGGEAHAERDLDDPSLTPFWEAAAELGAPVFLHPVFAGASPRAVKWGMVNAVARPNETAISLSRLLYAGIPQRFPGLKLVISHGGGALPFILGRLKRNYDFLKSEETIYDPVEGFKQLYFDTVVFEPQALQFLLNLTDASKVMLGSDAPFPIRDPYPRLVVESEKLDLTDEQRANILSGNAQNVFKIKE
ncbi:amidohydrolase family protein [Brevibacillus sp. TJ4]|uniref:amidohydrolase family protein n=1 Tax=Brevibacillus sp. TJ4 TaxID=3234853 RepID=UPI003B9E4C16